MGGDGASAVAACSLGAGDLARRAGRWEAVTARSLRRASRTERGVRLAFGAGPGVASELRALVALERDCCGFAAWSVRQDGDELTVEVRGHGGQAIAAVQALFPVVAHQPENPSRRDSRLMAPASAAGRRPRQPQDGG